MTTISERGFSTTPEGERSIIDAMQAIETAFLRFYSNIVGSAEDAFEPIYRHVWNDSTYERNDDICQAFWRFERDFHPFREAVFDWCWGEVEWYEQPDYYDLESEFYNYPKTGDRDAASVILNEMIEYFDSIFRNHPVEKIELAAATVRALPQWKKSDLPNHYRTIFTNWQAVKIAVGRCLTGKAA